MVGKIRSKILNILFWSVVTAAFIGPGTVTTATKAGAFHQFDLLWTLVFSTLACMILQEASARLTIRSGHNLGEAIARRFADSPARFWVFVLVLGAIILGSAAYEAGNILGSISGLSMVLPLPRLVLLAGIAILAFYALNLPSVHSIARFMGYIVFFMGISFLYTAFMLRPPLDALLTGALIPKIPDGAGTGLLILGLIGTTVVPYDLFLGSGVLEKSQRISDMRFGLITAIALGGVISITILIVGTAITREMTALQVSELEFSFELLRDVLVSELGVVGLYVFALGMFAAGFSSAITAPLASAITARSLFKSYNEVKWRSQSRYFKSVSFSILAVGLFFGLINVPPIPAIILAQAFNGLILPFISVFLFYVVNDALLMGRDFTNSVLQNIMMAIVVWVTMILGLNSVMSAMEPIFAYVLQTAEANEWLQVAGFLKNVALRIPPRVQLLYGLVGITLLGTIYLVYSVYVNRNRTRAQLKP